MHACLKVKLRITFFMVTQVMLTKSDGNADCSIKRKLICDAAQNLVNSQEEKGQLQSC